MTHANCMGAGFPLRLRPVWWGGLLLLSLAPVVSSAETLLWLEAEDFSTATMGLKIVRSPTALRTSEENDMGRCLLGKSGQDAAINEQVSGSAYVEVTEGVRFYKNSDIRVQYDFTIEREGDYYLWVRTDSPPPCYRYFSLWFDSEKNKDPKLSRLNFDYAGLWTWWPWGGIENRGKASPIRLAAGPHTLFLSDPSLGLRVDKLLLTDVGDYVPAGPSQHYYNGSFEPSGIQGGHGWDKVSPNATGWIPQPPEQWAIEEDPFSGNHHYRAGPPRGTNDKGAATALIDQLHCACFSASFRLVFRDPPEVSKADALFVHGYRSASDFDAVRVTRTEVSPIAMRDGRLQPVQTGGARLSLEPDKFHSVLIRRGRADLEVVIDSAKVFSCRGSYPLSGGVGVGSFSGGVGFDDVAIRPTDDPEVHFDFADLSDPALDDWKRVRGGDTTTWSPSSPLAPGDVLLYQTPGWMNSELTVDLLPGDPFSILFPFQEGRGHVETRILFDPSPRIEVVRHLDGRTESRGAAAIELPNGGRGLLQLTLQSTQGLFGVFAGDRRLVETNEYDLLSGTLGFSIGSEALPVRRIQIRHKEMMVENFSGGSLDALQGNWEIVSGSWKVARLFGDQSAGDDGQLAALGAGTLLFGASDWSEYHIQASVYLDESSEAGLLGRVDGEREYEVYCRAGEIQIRRIVAGTPMVLEKRSIDFQGPGWHRLGFSLGKGSLAAEIDGSESLRVSCTATAGRAGLRNYGDSAAFDNVSVHILGKKEEEHFKVESVDPLVLDIQQSILNQE